MLLSCGGHAEAGQGHAEGGGWPETGGDAPRYSVRTVSGCCAASPSSFAGTGRLYLPEDEGPSLLGGARLLPGSGASHPGAPTP